MKLAKVHFQFLDVVSGSVIMVKSDFMVCLFVVYPDTKVCIINICFLRIKKALHTHRQ